MDRLLTPEEVAKRLAVSPKSIREWLRNGKLRGVKVGRLWRISPQALDRFLNNPDMSYDAEKGTERKMVEAGHFREYTRKEIRDFLKADKIGPEIARKVEKLLEP
ncbi:MAG: helix-turn-helix domain-containing protein [Firmicutes bacterium]|nr:helix-turn-helix domain-containing protein [Bacillota bacterium]